MCVLSRAEKLAESGGLTEPEMETVIVYRKKRAKSERDVDLEGIESVDEWLYMSEEES